MTQYVINIGTSPNSGTGDQLRTAFNEVNLNFNQLFAAGPVGSNITIANNTIAVTNVNGNLILAPNGTGTVQTAGHLVPTIANVRNLGAYNNRFNTVYSQYLDVQSGVVSGNLTVNGNLVVTGNTVTVDTSTLNVANITIEVASGAPYAALADGAGLTVGGAGATWLYSAVANAWVSNLPIAATAFIGDGSQLTNVAASIDAGAMTGNTIASTVLYSSLTSVGVLANLTVGGNAQFNQTITSNAVNSGSITAIAYSGNGAGLSSVTGSNVTGTVGNATYATYAGTANVANLAALATQAVNSDTALYASRSSNSDTANTATFATTANCATYATNASLANSAVVAGRAETIDIQTTITVTGNIVTGGIKTDNYYFANGTPATFGGGTGNYSNANVAAYLPTYSGDLQQLGNITSYGTANLGNTNINSTLTVGVVSAAGNIQGGAVYANGFFYGNGAPFTGAGYVLGDQQFYGNGSSGPYTMTQSSTNNAVLVTINGLTQTPGTTYFVAGNEITFSDGINPNELVDIRFLGTGAGSSNYGNSNVQSFLGSGNFAGNIIPSGNAVYSLGNATNQWNDLWVSNATIYLNSIPLSVNGNGALTFNGNAIVTDDGGDNVVVIGDVTANAFIGDGSQLTGITATANTGNIGFTGDAIFDLNGIILENADLSHGATAALLLPPNGSANSIQLNNIYGNIILQAGADHVVTATWTFDNTGNLSAPGNVNLDGNIVSANPIHVKTFNGLVDYQFTNSGLFVVSDGTSFGSAKVKAAGGSSVALSSNDENNQVVTDNISIRVNAGSNTWTYDPTGNLTLPGNTFTVNYANGTAVSLSGTYGNANVAAYLPTYTGELGNVGNITANLYVDTTLLWAEEVSATGYVLAPEVYGNINGPLANSTARFTLMNDGTLLSGNVASPHNFVANTLIPDIDLRNSSGTGMYTQSGSNLTIKVNTAQSWIFDSAGTLAGPGVPMPDGAEAMVISGSRTIVGGFDNPQGAYAATFAGASPALVYTASSTIVNSAKITFVIESNYQTWNWEQFDVVVNKNFSGGVDVMVINRTNFNPVNGDTQVTASVNGSNIIEIYLQQPGTGTAYVNYNSVEFKGMVD